MAPSGRTVGKIKPMQKLLLVDFMKSHPGLNRGMYTDTFTIKDAQKLWQDVTVTLNAVPGGSVKDWHRWRKTWHDLKINIKMKANQLKVQGGLEPICGVDKEILDISPSESIHIDDDGQKEEAAAVNALELKYAPSKPSSTHNEEVHLPPEPEEIMLISGPSTVTSINNGFNVLDSTTDCENQAESEEVILTNDISSYHERKLDLMREDLEDKKLYRRRKLDLFEASLDTTKDLVVVLSNLHDRLSRNN